MKSYLTRINRSSFLVATLLSSRGEGEDPYMAQGKEPKLRADSAWKYNNYYLVPKVNISFASLQCFRLYLSKWSSQASKHKLIFYTSIPFQNAQNKFSMSKTLEVMSKHRFELQKDHILPRGAKNSANMNPYLVMRCRILSICSSFSLPFPLSSSCPLFHSLLLSPTFFHSSSIWSSNLKFQIKWKHLYCNLGRNSPIHFNLNNLVYLNKWIFLCSFFPSALCAAAGYVASNFQLALFRHPFSNFMFTVTRLQLFNRKCRNDFGWKFRVATWNF